MSTSVTAAAADYGPDEAAMQAYLLAGERRAYQLGNRGPIRFEARAGQSMMAGAKSRLPGRGRPRQAIFLVGGLPQYLFCLDDAWSIDITIRQYLLDEFAPISSAASLAQERERTATANKNQSLAIELALSCGSRVSTRRMPR